MLHLHFISKSQAKEIGLKRFFDGSMCKHGHISERNVSNGFCSECTAIYQAEYEAKRRVNTERKAYMKAYGYVWEGYAVTSDGTVTFYAYKKPAATITVGLKGVQNG